MSAVDTYVSGRRPRYLWDSLKVAKLIPDLHIQIIDSIIEGCRQAGCILVGGETAEMPDLYKYDWMADVDTFVIGFPDPELEFVPVRPGQEVWGWPSFGVCANGFSLVRKVFKLKEAPSMARRRLERKWSEFDGLTLAEELMRPTPIWIKTIEEERERGVKFARHAHITGGGMPGNIPRILPANCKVIIHRTNWIRPTVFPLIQLLGSVPDQEMDRTFNQGVIVVSIVEPDGETIRNGHAFFMGEIEERQGDEPQVILSDTYSDHEGLLFQKGGKS